MKNKIFFAMILAFVVLSCNQKNKEATKGSPVMDDNSTMMNNDTISVDNNSSMDDQKMYSCPMHPEVHGQMNDKCSKCGMALTEPVTIETKDRQ